MRLHSPAGPGGHTLQTSLSQDLPRPAQPSYRGTEAPRNLLPGPFTLRLHLRPEVSTSFPAPPPTDGPAGGAGPGRESRGAGSPGMPVAGWDPEARGPSGSAPGTGRGTKTSAGPTGLLGGLSE